MRWLSAGLLALLGSALAADPLPKPFKVAVRMNDVDTVYAMVQEAPELVHAEDSRGWTALMHAVDAGNRDLMQWLLGAGSDAAHADREGWTALHSAADTGSRRMARMLLDAGASPAAVNQFDETPLILARNAGEPAVADLLIAAMPSPDDWTDAQVDEFMTHHQWQLQRIVSGGWLNDISAEDLADDFPEAPYNARVRMVQQLHQLRNTEGHLFSETYKEKNPEL